MHFFETTNIFTIISFLINTHNQYSIIHIGHYTMKVPVKNSIFNRITFWNYWWNLIKTITFAWKSVLSLQVIYILNVYDGCDTNKYISSARYFYQGKPRWLSSPINFEVFSCFGFRFHFKAFFLFCFVCSFKQLFPSKTASNRCCLEIQLVSQSKYK